MDDVKVHLLFLLNKSTDSVFLVTPYVDYILEYMPIVLSEIPLEHPFYLNCKFVSLLCCHQIMDTDKTTSL
jgi:hypothetical protein